jgi:translin
VGDSPRRDLDGLGATIRVRLDAVNAARETGLGACRRTIRASGSAIRAVHRLQPERAASLVADAEASLRQAQDALRPFPAIAFAGFLHDAEKEYAEAVLFAALVAGSDVPPPSGIGVAPAAWLNGLAEAASELRRHILDTLRAGDLGRAEDMLGVMDEVYGVLITVDFPDAVTGGLRRTTDALRAVLERTRSDLTTTALQARLQASIDRATGPGGSSPLR